LSGAGKNSVSIKVAGAPQGGGKGGKGARMTTQDKEYDFIDDVKIRYQHLPPKLDDKGKKIPYTNDEMQKMRAKDGGFEASAGDLKSGQTVEMHLVRVKGAKGEDALKLYVSKIVIVAEPPMEMKDPNDKKPATKKP
jgi:hypothetical protein